MSSILDLQKVLLPELTTDIKPFHRFEWYDQKMLRKDLNVTLPKDIVSDVSVSIFL
jgi:hypothetical protein